MQCFNKEEAKEKKVNNVLYQQNRRLRWAPKRDHHWGGPPEKVVSFLREKCSQWDKKDTHLFPTMCFSFLCYIISMCVGGFCCQYNWYSIAWEWC